MQPCSLRLISSVRRPCVGIKSRNTNAWKMTTWLPMYKSGRASLVPIPPQPEVPKAPASPSWGFLLFQAQRKSPAPPMGRAFSRRLGYPQAPIPPLNRTNQNRLIGNPERRAGLGRQLGQIKFGPCVTQKPQIAVERLRDGLFPPHHRFPPWSRKPQGDRPRVCPGASLTFRP
jgi:hypothetical protein